MKTEFRYGQKIREQREARAWTQEYLATVAGVETRTIQRAERDQTKSAETLKAIGAAFNLDVSELRTVWNVAESRIKRIRLVDSYPGFVDAEESVRSEAFTRCVMVPLKDEFKEQVDDLCDCVFEDWDIIDPSERDLWKCHVKCIKGPLEKLFDMGFAFYVVDELRDLFLPKLSETIKPTTDHVEWNIRHFALVPRQGCFQMSKTEPLHRFDQNCDIAGRSVLRAQKEPGIGMLVYYNVLFAIPNRGTEEHLVNWCDACFPVLPTGSRISIEYLEQITALTGFQLRKFTDNVTEAPFIQGLSSAVG